MLGEHVFLPGGNLRLIEGMLQSSNVPVFYNTVAQHIDYTGDDGVLVQVGAAVV